MELKTIEVHLYKDFLGEDSSAVIYKGNSTGNYESFINAKLIIEIPDKKITYTEDGFKEALNFGHVEGRYTYEEFSRRVINTLFRD